MLFTHPFDVVRRKLQVVGIGGAEREYNGAIDCIRKISAKEGSGRGCSESFLRIRGVHELELIVAGVSVYSDGVAVAWSPI